MRIESQCQLDCSQLHLSPRIVTCMELKLTTFHNSLRLSQCSKLKNKTYEQSLSSAETIMTCGKEATQWMLESRPEKLNDTANYLFWELSKSQISNQCLFLLELLHCHFTCYTLNSGYCHSVADFRDRKFCLYLHISAYVSLWQMKQ